MPRPVSRAACSRSVSFVALSAVLRLVPGGEFEDAGFDVARHDVVDVALLFEGLLGSILALGERDAVRIARKFGGVARDDGIGVVCVGWGAEFE